MLSGALVALVALVFTVLEGTLLVTLDFALYENQAVALFQLVLKLLIALTALAIGATALPIYWGYFRTAAVLIFQCLLILGIITILQIAAAKTKD